MQSLGFETKNPTIFNMIADLEAEGREIDFEEFLDGITARLGDKETRVNYFLFRTASIKSLISLMMTGLALSMSIISEEWPKNWARL